MLKKKFFLLQSVFRHSFIKGGRYSSFHGARALTINYGFPVYSVFIENSFCFREDRTCKDFYVEVVGWSLKCFFISILLLPYIKSHAQGF